MSGERGASVPRVQAFSPSPHLLDYATSNAAIVNFTKGLGHNLLGPRIRVNSVAGARGERR